MGNKQHYTYRKPYIGMKFTTSADKTIFKVYHISDTHVHYTWGTGENKRTINDFNKSFNYGAWIVVFDFKDYYNQAKLCIEKE